ncbi:hypothetical protein ACFE04_023622 [Oxalis oulophora]
MSNQLIEARLCELFGELMEHGFARICGSIMYLQWTKSKAYPLMEGCTIFLLDLLIEGHGGYLETNPLTSPEHEFVVLDDKIASISYSWTMDISIIKQVFTAIIFATEVLGRTEDDIVQHVKKACPRLLPTKIVENGLIMD